MRLKENLDEHEPLPNGPGAAAILAMGIGATTMAVLAIVGDHSGPIRKFLIFYAPTGPLSGVTTLGTFAWIACWIALELTWKRRNVSQRVLHVGLALLALSFILMFPPIGDLF